MRVLITIQHPAHVHFFKHAYRELRRRGHEVAVALREKSVAPDLLDAYDIPYDRLAGESDSFGSLVTTQLTYEWRLLRFARRFDPDVIAAIGGLAAAHVAPLVGARSVVFTDSEFATLSNRLAFPVADRVVVPECYRDEVGTRHRRYAGYHELAYLHPDRFTPDRAVLDDVGVAPDESYVVLRLIAWGASHDAGQGGFDDVTDVVGRIESTGRRVLITAEGSSLPDALSDRAISVEPHRLHDLLFYADLTIGEGLTTAAESAVLGTPAIHVNTLSGGYLDELESEYGLVFGFHGDRRHERALETAVEVLERDVNWRRRRHGMLAEKRDVTDVILEELLDGGSG